MQLSDDEARDLWEQVRPGLPPPDWIVPSEKGWEVAVLDFFSAVFCINGPVHQRLDEVRRHLFRNTVQPFMVRWRSKQSRPQGWDAYKSMDALYQALHSGQPMADVSIHGGGDGLPEEEDLLGFGDDEGIRPGQEGYAPYMRVILRRDPVSKERAPPAFEIISAIKGALHERRISNLGNLRLILPLARERLRDLETLRTLRGGIFHRQAVFPAFRDEERLQDEENLRKGILEVEERIA